MGGIQGVEIRGKSIRIVFRIGNKQYKERLTVNGKSLPPTSPNLKYAVRLAEEIRRKITLNAFNWLDYFPDSPNAKSSSPTTFGKLADMWIDTKRNLVQGTVSGYENSVEMWKRMFGADTEIEKITHQMIASKVRNYVATAQ